MSKSKGNVIDPAEVIKKSGSEILRLWVAYEDYGQDLTIGDEIFKRVTETYRRIRNTIRFFLGNLSDFDFEKDHVDFQQMPKLDQWALIRLNQLIKTTTNHYDNYQFYKVFHAVNQFYTVDLSALYLDIVKDRLYTWKSNGNERRSTQTVLYHLLNNLTLIMTPILSFLAEETYDFINKKDKKQSVFLENFPEVNAQWKNEKLMEDFEQLLEIKNSVSKSLEELRKNKTIGSNLDASVELTLPDKLFSLVENNQATLKEILIVSQMSIKLGEKFSIQVEKAMGDKCPRCWHYFSENSTSAQYSDICPKCVEALS
jgi:isoleucyl-tRNA synthetase